MGTSKTQGKISIYRSTHNGGKIVLEIKDESSRSIFLNAEMGFEDFAKCVTGLSEVSVLFSLHNAENVGKRKIVEDRQVVYFGQHTDKETMSQWLKDNCQEDGWILDTYLGSKKSVEVVDGGVILLNYRVYKYVSEKEN